MQGFCAKNLFLNHFRSFWTYMQHTRAKNSKIRKGTKKKHKYANLCAIFLHMS